MQNMGWLFVRGTEQLHCESRVGGREGACELVLTLPHGIRQVEQYPDRAALLRRQYELIRAWKAQGWRELDADVASEELSGVASRR